MTVGILQELDSLLPIRDPKEPNRDIQFLQRNGDDEVTRHRRLRCTAEPVQPYSDWTKRGGKLSTSQMFGWASEVHLRYR